MEQALRNRKLLVRHTSPVPQLDALFPVQSWLLDINDKVSVVTVNGDPSDNVQYNDTLRTLVWSNMSAERGNILSGALTFDHDFKVANGTVTSAENLCYNVAITPEEAPPGYEAATKTMVASLGLDPGELVDAPPAYMTATSEDDPSTAETKVQASQFQTLKRPKSVEDPSKWTFEERWDDGWDDAAAITIGLEEKLSSHKFMFYKTDEVTQFLALDDDGTRYRKEIPVQGSPDVVRYGFDITFSGMGSFRRFTGTLVDSNNVEYDWKGKFFVMTEVPRAGTGRVITGSDGRTIDELLYAVTNMGRSDSEVDSETGVPKPTDLAQKEADHVFGKLMFASVDPKIAELLFPGKYNLTDAEKKIQGYGREFLRRAGIHTILSFFFDSPQVKQKTKDKIRKQRCEAFLPMCTSYGGAPSDPTNDPVRMYGWDRNTNAKDLAQLQSEAKAVTEACYRYGYRHAVDRMGPFLDNAGEWYGLLVDVLLDNAVIQDWKAKARGGGGYAKSQWDIKTKLDLLWEEAQEKPEQKAKLPEKIQSAEQVLNVLNAAAFEETAMTQRMDDTLRADFLDFFRRLDDEDNQTERQKEFADAFKRQMLADESVPHSFATLGERMLKGMEALHKNPDFTLRELEATAKLHEARMAQDQARALNTDPPEELRGTPWKEGFIASFRSVLTMVAVTGLLYLYTAGQQVMEWDDKLLLVGQIGEGLVAIRQQLVDSAKFAWQKLVGYGEAAAQARWLQSTGAFIYRYVLAPIGGICRSIGNWIWRKIGTIGQALITGIRDFAVAIGRAAAAAGEVITGTVGRLGRWIQGFRLPWGEYAKTLGKCLSFGISALCFWVAVKDCREAWKHGTVFQKVTSLIGAAIAGLEVIFLAIAGVGAMVKATATVAFCTSAASVLAVAGIIFAVGLIIFSFIFQEDPIDDLVEEFGRPLGLLYDED